MTKQLFIYDDVKPITRARHAEMSLKAGADWTFAREINSVPLLVSEFAQAARHYPIVFTGSEDRIMPIAVLGIRNGQNSFLKDDGTWAAPYVPAFLRQYPFVFANTAEEGKLMLCIDEACSGLNTDGKGERLFDSEGNRTRYLEQMLEFAKQYQAQFRAAENFGKKLAELGLLEPMRATFKLEGVKEETLSGFRSITRKALGTLADDDVLRLNRNGMLEAIYLQIVSVGNFDNVVQAVQSKPAHEMQA